MQKRIKVFFIGLLCCLVPTWAAADVMEFQPNKDNTIYEADDDLSNGSGEAFFAGITGAGDITRALIQFDLSPLPDGATVNSVTLTAQQSNSQNNIPESQTVTLHRLNRDWGEAGSDAVGVGDRSGGGQGAPAEDGDATWANNFFPDQEWNTRGGDFVQSASASATIMGNGSYDWNSTEQLVADVQMWIDNPAGNFGWILIGTENGFGTAKRFDSREGTVPPVLTVDFTVETQAEPGTLQFQMMTYRVTESEGSIEVGVTRSGGTDGEVSVDYMSQDDVAVAGEDYGAVNGTLTWADGENGVKTFEITILEDSRFEGIEKLDLVLSNPTGGADLGDPSNASVEIEDEEDLSHKLYFPQFANGTGFFSQIILQNVLVDRPVHARIIMKTQLGEIFMTNINGAPVMNGVHDVEIPNSGSGVFETDAMGDLQVGSVTVCSDGELSGVILFGGDFGLAGVQSSDETSDGFFGSVETMGNAINTGIAVQNLEDEETTLDLRLLDMGGQEVAQAQLSITAMGQISLFVGQIDWDQEVDFSNFRGNLRVLTDGSVAATMLQTRTGQIATLPVTTLELTSE